MSLRGRIAIVGAADTEVRVVPDMSTTDEVASVTWNSADDRYYVSAFGKNLTDDRYKTASQAVGALWTFSNYGPPRFYGVQAGFRMGG